LIQRITSLGVLNSKLPELIQGRDLIGLGLNPGKEIGKLLQEIRDLQLAQQINTHDQAMTHATKRIKNILEKDNQ
jgi:poly(A) polymerase